MSKKTDVRDQPRRIGMEVFIAAAVLIDRARPFRRGVIVRWALLPKLPDGQTPDPQEP